MQNNSPLVSIILCTYNRAKYIQNGVESVLKQLYKNWELIIVDDGSIDNTYEKLETYLKKYKNIIYVKIPNQGPAIAKNIGIKIANGELITFLDSDDTISSNHILLRVNEFKKNKTDFIFGGINFIGPKSKQFAPDIENPGKKIHLSKCLVAGTLFIWKKILIKENGFPKVAFAEDYELMKNLLKKYSSKKIDTPTYNYSLSSENRMCDLYLKGGVAAIYKFQKAV
ncbi:MAG: glycosyltransferase family 2 protein [Bacteroidetes bacterium]|nr:glycosyltransferase family 2 protein [Bacteroidota bacterium]